MILLVLARAAIATPYSLLGAGGYLEQGSPGTASLLGQERQAMFEPGRHAILGAAEPGRPDAAERVAAIAPTALRKPTVFRSMPSLFDERRERALREARRQRNLFAPLPHNAPATDRLRHLIASAEARHEQYDAVQHGARRRPLKKPTQMTLGEIFAWIDATPGQPHAIGRYQFIPSTLRRLVMELDVGPREVFSPRLQDQLADILLEDAGYSAFLAGQMPRRTFMNNLAKIWAGLPTSSGRSYYHGHAGNRAVLTWASFDREMAAIFSR